ncbi:MAG: signal peptidase I [Bifidobacteriaceae bacterium]|nr:signal peptidase I [Bifidobacteriaceae bacterium]
MRGGARHSVAGHDAVRQGPVPLPLELALTALAVIVVAFGLKTFVMQSFYIPSSSMEDTFFADDRIVVSKLAPGLLDVHRGDIVVFRDPGGWSSNHPVASESGLVAWLHGAAQALGLAPEEADDFIVKRVIGVAGDTVACLGPGAPVTVNGQPLDETYLKEGVWPSEMAFSVVVPPDSLWVMGDNRASSWDSRYHQDSALGGAVALDRVVGVANLRLWPPGRFAILRNPGAVFEYVPELP